MEKSKSVFDKYRLYCIALAAALLIELFIFNFRSWQSLFLTPVSLPAECLMASDIDIGEDGFLVINDDSRIYLTKLDTVAGRQIHNVFLDLELKDAEDIPFMESGVLTLRPVMTDEGNSRGVTLAERKMRNDDDQSHFLWFAGAGQIKELSFGLSLSNGSRLKLGDIVINARQPVHVAPVRLLICCVLLVAAAALRKGSVLWKEYASISGRMRAAVAAAAGIAVILPFVVLIFSNDYLTSYVRFQPYHELAKALCEGRTYLDTEPPQWMKEMDNPYDETSREKLAEETGEEYLWDYVYHDGHYYVYYGIVPCLLLYLPFYLLGGLMLPNTLAVLFAAALLYVGLYLFFDRLAKRIEGIPYAAVLLLTVGTFMGCQMPFFLNQPDAYAVPVVWAEAFLVWGLYLWYSVAGTTKKDMACLAAGSLCMALTVGCRPNMAVYIFLCIPLFWKAIRQWKECLKADPNRFIKVSAAFAIPFIPVAVGLMIYNAVRFGSPFDFGYAYNLTVHDSVHVPFSLDKLWLGIYEYLLRVPALSYRFPFMSIGGEAGVEYNALGHTVTYMEYIFGGLLPCNLILLFIPSLFKKDKGEIGILRLTAVVCAGISLFLMLLDVEMGGVVYRYMADFSLTLLLTAGTAYMLGWKSADTGNARKLLRNLLIACVLASLVFHVNFYWLSGLKYPLIWGNTSLYYKIYRAFMFW